MCVFIPNCDLLKNDSDVETYSSIASNPFDHTGKCIRRFWWYLRVLPVLHGPEVVDMGVNTILKNMSYA